MPTSRTQQLRKRTLLSLAEADIKGAYTLQPKVCQPLTRAAAREPAMKRHRATGSLSHRCQ
jgi:hypothetical protein